MPATDARNASNSAPDTNGVSNANGASSPMRTFLEKILADAPETKDGVKAVAVQLYFKNHHVVQTVKGAVATNVLSGGLSMGLVPGVFQLLTVGTMPDDRGREKHVIISITFEADAIFRVDQMKEELEDSRIVSPGGTILPPPAH